MFNLSSAVQFVRLKLIMGTKEFSIGLLKVEEL